MKQILFGAIKPQGRLRESIKRDMEGCIGHLEELAPSIVSEQKIYGKDRLTIDSEQAELGRKEDDPQSMADVPAQYMWWNSESQSNWRDGYCCAALLLEDEKYCEQVEKYIEEILAIQDADGYLGIYKEDLRYRHKEENGELWSKSTLYRVLLAYYEKTGSGRVKTALERAFEELMKGYPMGASDPFCVKNSFSGHCHGLTIMDSLYEMYLLTDEKKYLDYAIWLYENFSENRVWEEDLQIKNIRNMDYLWKNHGAHLYEHMRAVIIAGLHRAEYRPLIDLMLAKLPYYLTPSGGPMGDEGIDRRCADASDTAYEFCSVTELFDSYALLLQETGEVCWADKMEWLYFNAGMGMKHPKESSIMYCKADNCYTADRRKNYRAPFLDERYKYSPVHQTTAVCCVPNMGRLTPHYVQNMYIRDGKEITAVLFGESEFAASVDHISVSIRQITNYPANGKVLFEITSEEPVIFKLNVRVPDWADGVMLDGRKTAVSCGKIEILKQWEGKQTVAIEFLCGVKFSTDLRNDCFVSHGPLVYALPIVAREETLLEYERKPFREVVYTSLEREKEDLRIHEKDRKSFCYLESGEEDWRKQKLEGRFWNGRESLPMIMVPMGGTILRKVTFKTCLEGEKNDTV